MKALLVSASEISVRKLMPFKWVNINHKKTVIKPITSMANLIQIGKHPLVTPKQKNNPENAY